MAPPSHMTTAQTHEVRAVGWVHSPLRRVADAPMQGDEGAPDARLQIEAAFLPGLDGLEVGQDILILTWLHQAPSMGLLQRPLTPTPVSSRAMLKSALKPYDRVVPRRTSPALRSRCQASPAKPPA